MTFALGTLHWSPDQFWASTYYEVSCAYVGNLKVTGAMKDWWTAEEIEAVEELKRRFPDKAPGGSR